MSSAVARKLFTLACRLNNWRASIYWLITKSTGPNDAATADAIEGFLKLLSRERPSLSCILGSYLSEVAQKLMSIELCGMGIQQSQQYVLSRPNLHSII